MANPYKDFTVDTGVEKEICECVSTPCGHRHLYPSPHVLDHELIDAAKQHVRDCIELRVSDDEFSVRIVEVGTETVLYEMFQHPRARWALLQGLRALE
jgi:hypothetical protein